MRKTRAEIRQAIVALLLDESWRERSNVQVAQQAGCTDKTVANVRRAMIAAGDITASEKRIGADGKRYPSELESRWESYPSTPHAYVVEVSAGLYKIGYTFSLRQRLVGLSWASADLKVIKVFPADDPKIVEVELHARFAHRRHHGELFALTTEDVVSL